MNKPVKILLLFIASALFCFSSMCLAAVQKDGAGAGKGSPKAPASNPPSSGSSVPTTPSGFNINTPPGPQYPEDATFPPQDSPSSANAVRDQDDDKDDNQDDDQFDQNDDKSLTEEQRQEEFERCVKGRLTDPDKEAFCKCHSGLESAYCEKYSQTRPLNRKATIPKAPE